MNSWKSFHNMRNEKIQQIVKWTVYVLLIVNFLFYIAEDWGRAIHTLGAGSAFLDWTSEFATSIDELAWSCCFSCSNWRPTSSRMMFCKGG